MDNRSWCLCLCETQWRETDLMRVSVRRRRDEWNRNHVFRCRKVTNYSLNRLWVTTLRWWSSETWRPLRISSSFTDLPSFSTNCDNYSTETSSDSFTAAWPPPPEAAAPSDPLRSINIQQASAEQSGAARQRHVFLQGGSSRRPVPLLLFSAAQLVCMKSSQGVERWAHHRAARQFDSRCSSERIYSKSCGSDTEDLERRQSSWRAASPQSGSETANRNLERRVNVHSENLKFGFIQTEASTSGPMLN